MHHPQISFEQKPADVEQGLIRLGWLRVLLKLLGMAMIADSGPLNESSVDQIIVNLDDSPILHYFV